MMLDGVRAARGEPRPERARRSAGRSPGTSAAAPATRTSSRPSSGRRASRPREARRWRPRRRSTRWLGRSVKRKEDERFIVGRGNYVDDIKLPGMLHMAILRSPFAHARINSIDTSRAAALPGVVAVVTGELLAQHNLAWMPTLSGDTQAVLATDKVRMQGQEVACVIAEDVVHRARRARADRRRLRAAARRSRRRSRRSRTARRVIRDDKEGQTDNRVYHWEAGDAEATERAFAEADRVVSLETHYPRCHPAPLECCGCVADVNPATGKATIYMTSQAPHAHRTVFALVAGLPEHKIRIISPDIGGGFGNKVPVYPGYVVATAASLLLGRPVKWIEDRTGNLISTGFARDFHMEGELALTDDGKMTGDPRADALRPGLRLRGRAADEVQGRALPHRHRLVRHPGRARRHRRRVHEQGAGRRRVPLLVPRHRGLVPHRAARPDRGVRARHRPGRAAAAQLHPARPVPVHVRDRLRVRLGRLRDARWTSRSRSSATRSCARSSGARARRRAGCSGSGSRASPRSSAPGPSRQYDILGIKMFDSAELRLHPTGKAILKLGVKWQGQGHETTFAQIVADELGLTARRRDRGGGRHRRHALRARHVRVPLARRSRARPPPSSPATSARRRRRSPRTCSRRPRRTSSGATRALLRQGRARAREDDAGGDLRRVHELPRGHGAGPRGHALLRPAEHDLPVRHVRRRRRDRPRHGRVEAAAGGRRRRLRRADQPDDRRGADHGRAHRGLRDGRDGADHASTRRATASAPTSWTT